MRTSELRVGLLFVKCGLMSTAMLALLSLTLAGLTMLPAVASGQPQFQLAALTVPKVRLPKGCSLPPEFEGSIRENPWVGNHPPTMASLRSLIEGPREYSSEHVLEGYQAIYMTVDRRWVRVRAIRFDDPKWTTAAVMGRLSEGPLRTIKGPVAVLLERIPPTTRLKGEALEQACYNVVQAHIPSIKFPVK